MHAYEPPHFNLVKFVSSWQNTNADASSILLVPKRKMELLIPHPPYLEAQKRRCFVGFGSIPRELIVNSVDFHEAATKLCSNFRPKTQSQEKAKQYVLKKAGRCSLSLQDVDWNVKKTARQLITPTIIADVAERELTSIWDGIPIVANCCQYPVRLDGQKRKHSMNFPIRTGRPVSVS